MSADAWIDAIPLHDLDMLLEALQWFQEWAHAESEVARARGQIGLGDFYAQYTGRLYNLRMRLLRQGDV